jgi:hypothetical protein
MLFNLKLLEDDKTIINSILKALVPEVDSYFKNSISKLKLTLPAVIEKAIINTPEYSSIQSGILQYNFGIPDPNIKLIGLLNIWSNNIEINYSKPIIVRNTIKCNLSAGMIKIDFSDVLYTEYAIVIDNLRGYSLPWLEWLLLEGNKTIIKNQKIIFGPNKASRTGFAVMRENQASTWKVPSQYAGTLRDNWITKAIDGAYAEIENTINKAFEP